jgi:NAD(P)-dependent dehydrogenase (short-subunit alcohol dehydrogenase family)
MINAARRVALVSGSSRGIGRAIAQQLARDGYAVVVNYVRQVDAAQQVVRQIEQDGGEAIAVQGSVAEAEDRDRLVQSALNTWGRLDVLVNNAGITSPGRKDLLELTSGSWDQVLATNLKGPFFLAQRAAQAMIQLRQTGLLASAYIINVSSISAYAVSTNRPDYCIAKAGMQMMTWLFADRLAENNIGVFEICPGVIESDMTAPVREKYDRLIADGLTPIRRWGQPEDVARAVSSLVSGAFPFSTGDRINIDGGFHIRRL